MKTQSRAREKCEINLWYLHLPLASMNVFQLIQLIFNSRFCSLFIFLSTQYLQFMSVHAINISFEIPTQLFTPFHFNWFGFDCCCAFAKVQGVGHSILIHFKSCCCDSSSDSCLLRHCPTTFLSLSHFDCQTMKIDILNMGHKFKFKLLAN